MKVNWSESLMVMTMKDTTFWIVMPCISDTLRRFGEIRRLDIQGRERNQSLPTTSAGSLLLFPFCSEDRGDRLLRNIVLSLNYRELQSLWLMTLHTEGVFRSGGIAPRNMNLGTRWLFHVPAASSQGKYPRIAHSTGGWAPHSQSGRCAEERSHLFLLGTELRFYGCRDPS